MKPEKKKTRKVKAAVVQVETNGQIKSKKQSHNAKGLWVEVHRCKGKNREC